MQKILLFYQFRPVSDPEAVRLWQKSLCEKYQLKGRILIAMHGINGTVGGDINDLKAYCRETKQYFKKIEYKWSEGQAADFPKLVVKVRPEIVTFGTADKIKVNQQGIVGGGKRLKPHQLHKLLKSREDVVLFDGRNQHEAAIGRFKDAHVPAVNFSREFEEELQKPEYETLKQKPVVTYCTGGIRCEVLTVLMKKQGFRDVYQLDGGIVKYGEKYGDDGLWEGALYVFDNRLATKFSPQAKDIGSCVFCGASTSDYLNCEKKACNKLYLGCSDCATAHCPSCLPAATTV